MEQLEVDFSPSEMSKHLQLKSLSRHSTAHAEGDMTTKRQEFHFIGVPGAAMAPTRAQLRVSSRLRGQDGPAGPFD